MKTVSKKIQNGDYRNTEEYPDLNLKKTNPDVWNEIKRQYLTEDKRLINQFKGDLEEEFHMTKHPFKDVLFDFAWKEGHSGGFHEILNHYEELHVSLIQPMNDYIEKRFKVVL